MSDPLEPRSPRGSSGASKQPPIAEKYSLAEVYRLIEPGPVMLMTTMEHGRANIMTMSWHMMVNFTPPLVACVVGTGDYSFSVLRAEGECVIAVPPVELAPVVVKIGNCSGRTVNKFERFGLTPLPGDVVSAPLVAECFANLECRVVDTSLVKKYEIFVLEVVRAWFDPQQKRPKTIHHRGHGHFVVDGRSLVLPSKMP